MRSLSRSSPRSAVLRSCVALVLALSLAGSQNALGDQAPTPAEAMAEDSFERDGLRLHYRTQGSGTPIVFLSGGPGIPVDYLFPLGDLVPSSFQRIFLEQRGTGRSVVASPSRSNVNLREAVGDLEALRRHLGVDRLLLLGHSYGGMLAMAYASTHPDRVDRLILLASGGPTTRFWSYFGANINARLRQEERDAQRYWTEAMTRGLPRQKGVNEVARVTTPVYFFDREKGLAFVRSGPPEAIDVQTMQLIQADLVKDYDLRPGLATLDRPVLVVHALQDPIGDLTAEEIRASMKGAVVEYINESGHFIWLEQPDKLRAVLHGFLERGQSR